MILYFFQALVSYLVTLIELLLQLRQMFYRLHGFLLLYLNLAHAFLLAFGHVVFEIAEAAALLLCLLFHFSFDLIFNFFVALADGFN